MFHYSREPSREPGSCGASFQGACHATNGPPKIGPPGPSMAAIDGPPGPSMAAIGGPPLPQMVPPSKVV